ncbi:fimbria/pilus periplasmic chaperone [Candidatus Synechococcus calcipolaris G9]|uniref:Fimbria/pilus periplasmic chaperone n=1 Tax=Candidatus Synechococcus calcipolaris G9 TaxID=1497997 RepID=A0ABT6F088_9SYNE|nr:fimbria/pilus periplasmic chaperone [Candidatus Synechococcus calcipolaris]MDG2991278.1 fimbria/pilus periplasmic chaperone [Candidatus Synechococcus calcipolaris G9]
MLILWAFLVLAGQSVFAQSQEFYLSAIQVFLSPRQRTTLLTINNTGSGAIDFEISAEKWQQTENGIDQLSPADGEIVVFPLILNVPPGESRNIRIGTRQPPSTVEGTYRLLVAELPAADIPETQATGPQLRIIKRMSLPVFIEPLNPIATAEIVNTNIQNGQLGFTIRNTGNVHIQTLSIALTGQTADGEMYFERNLDSVYVLAERERSFSQVDLPQAGCAQVRQVTIRLGSRRHPLSTQLPTPNGICR